VPGTYSPHINNVVRQVFQTTPRATSATICELGLRQEDSSAL